MSIALLMWRLSTESPLKSLCPFSGGLNLKFLNTLHPYSSLLINLSHFTAETDRDTFSSSQRLIVPYHEAKN